MTKKIEAYRKEIVKALKASGRYNRALGAQIDSLAGLMRTLAIAHAQIDDLESATIAVVSRYGNETLAPHPVFKIQKDAQDGITRQMKALGLTVEELAVTDTADPLIELTRQVRNAGRAGSAIVRPD